MRTACEAHGRLTSGNFCVRRGHTAERASLPAAELQDTATVRLALSRTPAGKAAAGSTQRRKRPVFCNALGYAAEQGHPAANPIDRIQWTTTAVAQTVDRRAVASPAQARSLLAAVRGLSDRRGGRRRQRAGIQECQVTGEKPGRRSA